MQATLNIRCPGFMQNTITGQVNGRLIKMSVSLIKNAIYKIALFNQDILLNILGRNITLKLHKIDISMLETILQEVETERR